MNFHSNPLSRFLAAALLIAMVLYCAACDDKSQEKGIALGITAARVAVAGQVPVVTQLVADGEISREDADAFKSWLSGLDEAVLVKAESILRDRSASIDSRKIQIAGLLAESYAPVILQLPGINPKLRAAYVASLAALDGFRLQLEIDAHYDKK